MKQNLIFFIFLLMGSIPVVKAQPSNSISDTTATQTYKVSKKNEKVRDIAKNLKVDVSAISKLNNGLSPDSMLVRGQNILVPEYSDVAAIKKGHAADGKGHDAKEIYDGGRNTAPVAAAQSNPPIDTELIQNKILLIEATLDLNQTLLQGIKASIDSLNVKDKGIVDAKNMPATIHSMQRSRDKALLTPFLLHMRDSLNTEIHNEATEKAKLEYLLKGNESPLGKQDTTSLPTKENIAVASGVAKDTLAVSKEISHHPTKADSVHIRPVIEAGSSYQTATSSKPVMHWETAKALYYDDDTTAPANNESHGAAHDAQSAQNNSDTSAYIPLRNVQIVSVAHSSDSVGLIKAQLFLTKAMKANNQKNYKTAVENLKKALDIMPDYYDAWFALGEADTHLGLYTKALNEFKTCANLDSSKAVLFYKMGNIHLKLKQKTEAYDCFKKSLSIDVNYIPAIVARASIYEDRKQYRTAIMEYNRVLELDMGYHTMYKLRAMAEYWLKDYNTSIDDFTRFLIFDDSDASVYYYRGLAKLGTKNAQDACADLSVSAKLGYPAASKAIETNCK
jgi:tetratricopeptide (TPR) repeat protein